MAKLEVPVVTINPYGEPMVRTAPVLHDAARPSCITLPVMPR